MKYINLTLRHAYIIEDISYYTELRRTVSWCFFIKQWAGWDGENDSIIGEDLYKPKKNVSLTAGGDKLATVEGNKYDITSISTYYFCAFLPRFSTNYICSLRHGLTFSSIFCCKICKC